MGVGVHCRRSACQPLISGVFLLGSLALVLISACTERHVSPDQPPETTLTREGTPPSPFAGSTWTFSWTGADPDGVVSGYDYRLLMVARCDTLPVLPDTGWVATTATSVEHDFTTDRDANWLFEVRARDNAGLTDPTPAITCFVLQSPAPACSILTCPPTTQPGGQVEFQWTATKRDRSGALITALFAFSWQITELSPSPGVIVPWSAPSLQTSATLPFPGGTGHYLFQLRAIDSQFPEIESDICQCEF